MITTYTLYRTVGNGAPKVVGFYDDWPEGVAAMEEDMTKHDDVGVGYSLTSDKKEDDADNGDP